jgi:hypothetical protein
MGQRGDALPGDTIPLHYHAARRRKEHSMAGGIKCNPKDAFHTEGEIEGGLHTSTHASRSIPQQHHEQHRQNERLHSSNKSSQNVAPDRGLKLTLVSGSN